MAVKLPLDSSPASSVSIVSATTHDTSRTKYHIDELSTFAQRLEDVRCKLPVKGFHLLILVRPLLAFFLTGIVVATKTFKSCSFGGSRTTWALVGNWTILPKL